MAFAGAQNAGRKLKMTKIKQNDRLKYTVILFAVLSVYSLVIINGCSFPKVIENLTYVYHCVDYSMGFCTGFLPGAVFNFLVKDPSVEAATVFDNILLFTALAGVAVLLAKWLAQFSEEKRGTGIRLLSFYVVGSFTFAAFGSVLGMLDSYWLFFSVLFIALMQNRFTRLILPVFPFLCILVHYGAMITYVPFFALLLLYEIISADKKQEKRIWTVIFFASCAVAVGSFVYFQLFEKQNLTYDLDTFNGILKSKGSVWYYYYDFSLYRNNGNAAEYIDALQDIGGAGGYIDFARLIDTEPLTGAAALFPRLAQQIKIHLYLYQNGFLKSSLTQLLCALAVIAPVIALLYYFLIGELKKYRKNKLRVFFYICLMLLLPLTVFGSFLISVDTLRWLTHGFLGLFTTVLFILYKDGENGLARIKTFFSFFPDYVPAVYLFIYALSVMRPYA